MKDENAHYHHQAVHKPRVSPDHSSSRWKLAYWAVGLGSLIWLLMRSGLKPRRLAYPCQRVAVANSLGFLAYLATLLSSATLLRRLKSAFDLRWLVLLVVCLLLTTFLQGGTSVPLAPALAASPNLPGWTVPSPISKVFAITNVPQPQHSLDGGHVPSGVSADEALHDDGVDALVNLMEAKGDYFYKTTAHPTGLFGSNDVIVIKVNNQWGGRNGTNTDVVKGVIYRLIHRPSGSGVFTGAVIIAENAQGSNSDWYNESSNNSQFQNQSYQEVAQAFAGQGYHVCIANWNGFYATLVNDYNAGNSSDGYVLDATDNKLSYPKFRIADCGGMDLRISMRKGLWNGSSFDNTRLKMINLPVLKRHGASGATIALKNYIGFITTASGAWANPANPHCWLLSVPNAEGAACPPSTQEYGLIARQMFNIRRADLDIVDAIWVNPRNNIYYDDRVRRQDVLLASRDPFAVDYYASDYLLAPLIQTYEPSLDYTQAEASHHGSLLRSFLQRNVFRLRALESVDSTINIDDSMTRQQELDQFNVYVADATNPPPPPSLTYEDSFKRASSTDLQGGGQPVTCTVVLYEVTSATLTLTDTIPAPLTYVPGSIDIQPAWKDMPSVVDGSVHWSGTVTSTQPVTITFQAQAPVTTTTWAVINRAQISRNGAPPIERMAISFINGLHVYLPLVFKGI